MKALCLALAEVTKITKRFLKHKERKISQNSKSIILQYEFPLHNSKRVHTAVSMTRCTQALCVNMYCPRNIACLCICTVVYVCLSVCELSLFFVDGGGVFTVAVIGGFSNNQSPS